MPEGQGLVEHRMTPSPASQILSCQFCGKPVTETDTFCPACDGVQPVRGHEDYFTVLGLPRSLDVDSKAAEARFYELSRRLHPDRFGRKPEQLENAMQRSALLNDAYRALRSADTRLDYFLDLEGRELGADPGAEAKAKAQVPAELAEEYFELQEALSEGGAGDALKKLSARLDEIGRENTAKVESVARRWSEAGLGDGARRAGAAELRKSLRRELQQVKTMRQYLMRMREDIERRTGAAAG